MRQVVRQKVDSSVQSALQAHAGPNRCGNRDQNSETTPRDFVREVGLERVMGLGPVDVPASSLLEQQQPIILVLWV